MTRQRKNTIFLLAFFFLLSAGFMYYYFKEFKQQPRHNALRVIGEEGQRVQAFSFVNQEGKTISQEDVNGKIYVVEYFFTTCKGICPKMNENMNEVYKSIRGQKDILILSHTVDPQKDSVAALKNYSLRFDADPEQWMFLTGDKKELYDMARYSYLISAQDDTTGMTIDEDFIHDNHFVLVDRYGRLRGDFYDGLSKESVKKLIADIQILAQEKE